VSWQDTFTLCGHSFPVTKGYFKGSPTLSGL